MPTLGFGPLFNYPKRCDGIFTGSPVVDFPNVKKGITVLVININLNSYTENIKNRKL